MPATILDGKKLAQQIRSELAEEVVEFIQNNGVVPCLAAVLVGDDPASEVYVRNKRKACDEVGIESQLHRLPADVSADDLLHLVAKLNKDDAVHGILVQLAASAANRRQPRRAGRSARPRTSTSSIPKTSAGSCRAARASSPAHPTASSSCWSATASKSPAGTSSSSAAATSSASRWRSCSPSAAPAATPPSPSAHSRTPDLPAVTRLADILIVAIGRPKFITADMVKPGATVIDVGINRTPDGIVGDVDFDAVREVAGAITPVPGGVGR